MSSSRERAEAGSELDSVASWSQTCQQTLEDLFRSHSDSWHNEIGRLRHEFSLWLWHNDVLVDGRDPKSLDARLDAAGNDLAAVVRRRAFVRLLRRYHESLERCKEPNT
jgi:hypothetical protein